MGKSHQFHGNRSGDLLKSADEISLKDLIIIKKIRLTPGLDYEMKVRDVYFSFKDSNSGEKRVSSEIKLSMSVIRVDSRTPESPEKLLKFSK